MEEVKNMVVEETEDLATCGSGKGLKIAAGAVGLVLVGTLTYKYVIKPIAAKIQAKKEQEALETEFLTNDEEDIEVEE